MSNIINKINEVVAKHTTGTINSDITKIANFHDTDLIDSQYAMEYVVNIDMVTPEWLKYSMEHAPVFIASTGELVDEISADKNSVWFLVTFNEYGPTAHDEPRHADPSAYSYQELVRLIARLEERVGFNAGSWEMFI